MYQNYTNLFSKNISNRLFLRSCDILLVAGEQGCLHGNSHFARQFYNSNDILTLKNGKTGQTTGTGRYEKYEFFCSWWLTILLVGPSLDGPRLYDSDQRSCLPDKKRKFAKKLNFF